MDKTDQVVCTDQGGLETVLAQGKMVRKKQTGRKLSERKAQSKDYVQAV